MKPPPFDYVAPRSLEEALAALAEGGDDAKPIAGGQSLVPALSMRLVRPSLLVDLAHAGLSGIDQGDAVTIGATAPQLAVERDPRCHPLLREALGHVGHRGTRARGTVGGSIAHADGAAEIPLCLTALGGAIEVRGPEGSRSVAPAGFFVTHYLTTLAPGELVVASSWPRPAPGEGAAFEEIAIRRGDFALTMVAVVLRRDRECARDVRVAVGAVTDRPVLVDDAAAALEGEVPTAERRRAAGAAAAALVDPPASIHASAAYRRAATAALVERALERAWERAG